MINVFTKVSGMERVSLLDYPDHTSCVLFSHGCNFRCKYCYNKVLIDNNVPEIKPEIVKQYLLSRKNIIDAVVFSGGECTLYPDYLKDSIAWCKDNGFLVKIDTNGSNPDLAKELINNKTVDYVALDYKCPIGGDEYKKFYGNKKLKDNFKETLLFLIDNNCKFETRTTIHPDITDEETANEILRELSKFNYKGTHYFQFYNDSPETLGHVNNNPRRFRTEMLIVPDLFKVEFRNKNSNNRRIG